MAVLKHRSLKEEPLGTTTQPSEEGAVPSDAGVSEGAPGGWLCKGCYNYKLLLAAAKKPWPRKQEPS